ncbi:hypothetical protein CEXT_159851 [Caerostris extrusa]|uniref:Uncharacterized protein n=1 Tax=Caerostris extrusa TaxID=172846 RepID=A0AAV4TPL2_CAEEX|nr:hypothetical protein CEXT_159851 [Caerostris extrusa]
MDGELTFPQSRIGFVREDVYPFRTPSPSAAESGYKTQPITISPSLRTSREKAREVVEDPMEKKVFLSLAVFVCCTRFPPSTPLQSICGHSLIPGRQVRSFSGGVGWRGQKGL